jgi:hypothetical protein
VVRAAPSKRKPEQYLKAAATKLGISLEAYRRQIAAGKRWCNRCQRWQPVAEFLRHPGRTSGFAGECVEGNRAAAREYQRRKRRRQAEAS